jgi:hypothetical protein
MALTKIKTSGIADNAITNAKMADDAIDSADFVDGSIDNAHLAGSIAVSKTLLAGGTGLTLSTNTLNVDAAQTQITSVGTIGTGVWNASVIASAYLDADTAHLSTAQTFTGLKSFSGNSMPQLIIKEVSGSPDIGLEFTSGGVGRGRIFFDDSTNNFVLQGTTYGGGGYSDDLVIDVNGNAIFGGDVAITGGSNTALTIGDTTGDTFQKMVSGSASGIQLQLFHGGTQTATINSNTTNIFSVYDGSAGATNVFNIADGGNATFTGDLIVNETSGDAKLYLKGQGQNNGIIYFEDEHTTSAYALGNIHCNYTRSMFFQTGGATTALTLDGSQNATFAGGVALSNSESWNPVLTLTNLNNASTPAQLQFWKRPADNSMADNDYLGQIAFAGINSANQDTYYTILRAHALDVTDGTEDSGFYIDNYVDGTGDTNVFKLEGSTATFGGYAHFDGVLTGLSGGGSWIGRNHAYDTMELMGYGAEFMIGAQNNALYINYRTCNNGASSHTPSLWYWNAGSSTSWATHKASAWNTGSDIKLKKDIEPVPYGLDAINLLQPKKYKLKQDDSENLGLIAQDVEGIIDEIVSSDDKTDTKFLNYTQLIPVLIKAVQELSAKVTALENA